MDDPDQLDGATILYSLHLKTPQSSLIHLVNGAFLTGVQRLGIGRYQDANAIYLLHCDEQWNVLTDDLFESSEEAQREAEEIYPSMKGQAWTKHDAQTPLPGPVPVYMPVSDEELQRICAQDGQMAAIVLLRTREQLSLFDAVKRVQSLET